MNLRKTGDCQRSLVMKKRILMFGNVAVNGKDGLKMGAFRGLQGNVNITGSFSARTDCTCTFIVCMCEYVYSVAVFCGVLL